MLKKGRRYGVRKDILIVIGVAALMLWSGVAWAQDAGVPDTLYVEVYPGDEIVDLPGPWFVRFPMYVTNDVVDPRSDSIAGFVLPLCYEVQPFGQMDYCSLSLWWNNTSIISYAPEVQDNRSIFRHLPSMQDVQIHNQMLDLNADLIGGWDFLLVDLGDQISRFWFTAVPTGTKDQRWPPGSRSLLATMTFRTNFSDSLQLCIDTCFWPPATRFAFSNSNAETYIPRNFLEICETISPFGPAPSVECPDDQSVSENGEYAAAGFSAQSYSRTIQSVDVQASGDGLGAAWVENVVGLGTANVQGDVVCQVTNHCLTGGTVTVTAYDDVGRETSCSFEVIFGNDPPELVLPPTRRALAGYTMNLLVRGLDSNEDQVVTWWNGIQNQIDPGRNPAFYPIYHSGNPGELVWDVTESDTGSWIASFSAADACGAVDTQQVSVVVGVPYCGDLTGEGELDISDIVFLLNYLFKGGDQPVPLCRGDANCNGERDAGDVVLLLNFLFRNGTAPCFGCCEER
jgi:hypothetical protein